MSKTIMIDADGSSLFMSATEKLEQVKAQLKPTLENVAMKIARDRNALKPVTINYDGEIVNRLHIILMKFPMVDYIDALNIDEDTVKDYFDNYLELLSFIYEYSPKFVATRYVFSNWLAIPPSAYDKLLVGNNPAVADLLDRVNGFCCDTAFVGASTAHSKEKSTTDALRVKKYGVGIDLKPTGENVTNVLQVGMSENEMSKRLQNILGNKRIGE